ncbi:MAG: hypothetical protein AB8G99_11430 [Planctomycetaceae bacterium]
MSTKDTSDATIRYGIETGTAIDDASVMTGDVSSANACSAVKVRTKLGSNT